MTASVSMDHLLRKEDTSWLKELKVCYDDQRALVDKGVEDTCGCRAGVIALRDRVGGGCRSCKRRRMDEEVEGKVMKGKEGE
nr:hypothetical protein CFP56_52855 [Quercus suber]